MPDEKESEKFYGCMNANLRSCAFVIVAILVLIVALVLIGTCACTDTDIVGDAASDLPHDAPILRPADVSGTTICPPCDPMEYGCAADRVCVCGECVCATGATECEDPTGERMVCTDLMVDLYNCGACGMACAGTCEDGICTTD